MGMYYSFTNWNGVSGNVEWVGLDNFKQIFTNDSAFAQSFWFTTKFTIVGVLLTNLVGFPGLLLNENIRARNWRGRSSSCRT